jgi:hypothetical protein
MVVWYNFGTSDADLTVDASGSQRDLTNANSVKFDGSDVKEGTGAALFSGGNYFQTINSEGAFSPTDLTFTCWCKITQKLGYATISAVRSQSPARGWIVYLLDNHLQVRFGASNTWDGDNINLYNNFADAIPTWRHIAVTMKQSTNERSCMCRSTSTDI